ncbi:MAG: hypothetical protein IMF07_04485 [Proteobacteria bacterium]|nr:hypothetical protein [Pseudomonadota bacterium]
MFKLSSKGYSLRILCATLSIFIFLVSGCKEDSKQALKTTPGAVSKEENKQKVLKIFVDIDTQKKLQSSADQGFKPWKNDAVEVAKECIIGKGIGAPGESTILSEDDSKTVVRVATKKEGSFNITLKRLVRPGGIWTATEIERAE